MIAEFPLAPDSPMGNPAPFWFIVGFKVLGFTLHMAPMHLWYAGMTLVALLSVTGRGHERRLAHRLVSAMPIAIALGINFGIVPLLFAQVGYNQVLYPANMLIGWFWMAVVPLLMVAYYGVYLYAIQVRREKVNALGIGSGIVSAVLFLAIGFIFTNNFSLMTNRDQMLAIYDRTNVAGAVTGLALNTGDPTLWPRWLMLFGLALTTTAVYILIDAVGFARRESAEYRAWASAFAVRLYAIGFAWFSAMGAWYLFSALPASVRQAAQADAGVAALFALTAALPAIVWLLARRAATVRSAAALTYVAIAQFLALALNAISRQWVQHRELSAFFDPAALPVKHQPGPMAVFLILFVAGLAVIGWMLRQLFVARSTPLVENKTLV